MTDVLPLDLNGPHHEEDRNNNDNEFALHLKPVFDACNYNGDGFVKIQDLIELGKQHSVGNSGEELELILGQLGNGGGGNGRISFDEFCFKVSQIFQQDDDIQPSPRDRVNSLEMMIPPHRSTSPLDRNTSPLQEIAEKPSEESRARSYTDSEGFFEEIDDTLSHSTTSTNDCNGDLDDPKSSSPLKNGKFHAPPNSYFAQMKRNSNVYSTYPPNGRLPKKGRKNVYNLQHRQLSKTSEYQSQEVGFEAFGEGDDWDESIASEPHPDTSNMLSPNNGSRFPRRLSGNHIASRLVRSAQTSLHGSMEEMKNGNHRQSFSDSDGDFNYLSDEIKKLSSQLTILKMDHDDHDDKQKRMREENKMLLNKINNLEEQLHDQKTTSQKIVQEEGQKYRKELQKVQRDQTENIDRLQMKLIDAEGEIENLKTVEPMLRKEIEHSLEERRLAQRKVENLQSEIIEKEKEIEQLKYKLKFKTDELDREKHERAEEVMVLTQEIENLKYMKNAAISQFDEHNDLLKQMEIIKKENNKLRSAQDDLRNQMFEQNTNIEMEKQHTLADELVTADKGDVLEALRAEENENHRLKQYIDQLLILIMTSDPTLLEK